MFAARLFAQHSLSSRVDAVTLDTFSAKSSPMVATCAMQDPSGSSGC